MERKVIIGGKALKVIKNKNYYNIRGHSLKVLGEEIAYIIIRTRMNLK